MAHHEGTKTLRRCGAPRRGGDRAGPGAGLAVLGALCVLAASAPNLRATPRRFAIVVGNNDGGPGKERLRYAERDARRVARVLRQLGGVERPQLLLGKSAADVRRAIDALARSAPGAAEDRVLFFYYSGHADAQALRLGSTRLRFAELRRRIQAFPARTAVTILDACQSGTVTRSKGGSVVPVVDVRFEDKANRGRVFISSSGPGESSQESDDLHASLFTYFLLSGLRGAADDSGDSKVSLEEAYRFAYRHTLRRTSGAIQGPQHPSFAIELRGTGQLVLTWLGPKGSYLVLPAGARGGYLVQQLPSGVPVAEVNKVNHKPLRIALAPGRYRVRKVIRPHELVGTVVIHRSRQTRLDESQMVLQPLDPTRGKGGDSGGLRLTHVLTVGYEVNLGYLVSAGLGHGVQLGYAWRLGPVDVGLLLGYTGGRYDRPDGFRIQLHEASVLGTLQWRYRGWRWVQPLVAIDVGAAWAWQRAEDATGGVRWASDPLFRYRGRIGGLVRLGGPAWLGLWGHVGQVVLRRHDRIGAPLAAGGGAAVLLAF